MQTPGIHHLSIEGDYEAGLRHLGAAYKVLDRLQRRLALGGIQSGGDWEPLGGGAWLYARVAMGVNAVRIVVPGGEQFERRATLEKFGPPDFLSGVVVGGIITQTPGSDGPVDTLERQYWPAPASRRKFDLREGLQDSTRLAVSHNPLISVARNDAEVRYSQHAGIRPSMYSGTMAAVVQLLLGYGKPGKSLYQQFVWTVEPQKSGPAESVSAGLGAIVFGLQVEHLPQPKLKAELRVRYDFRGYRTHGIAFDAKRRPWLVEISSINGVVAMPLPLHPDSETPAFRALLESRGDDEALAVLERLGGFPTGATFPESSEAMEALVSSGLAVQMLTSDEVMPFYQLTPYSSALGWAFNQSGTEAHNTGFSWDETDWQYGEHHAISLRIGNYTPVEPPARGGELKKHLSTLYPERPTTAQHQAFGFYMQKIDRLRGDEVEQLLGMAPKDAYEKLKKLKVPPIAEAKATLTVVSRGALINGGYDSPCQAKFWEPLLDNAIVSHDFSAQAKYPAGKPAAVSNTTILAFFAGDDLKTVKWFNDTRRKVIDEVDSNEEPCMYAGSWSWRHSRGTIGPEAGYYSNDFDLREETPDAVDIRKTTGKDLGWTACTATWPPDWPVGGYCQANRERTFQMRVEHWHGQREVAVTAFVWPAFAREAYYLARRKTISADSHTVGYSYTKLIDPNWAELYIPYSAFNGSIVDVLEECGNSTSRRVVASRYSPPNGGCNELVDEGSWASRCQVIDDLLFDTPLPALPEGLSETGTEEVEHTVKFVSAYYDPVDVDAESDAWFDPSPLPGGTAMQYMYATGNCLGTAQSVVYSESPSGSFEQLGAPSFPEMKRDAPCFIGVVQ